MISLATRLEVTKAIFTSSISPPLDSQVLVRAPPSVIQIDWHNSQLSLISCFRSLRHFRFWRKMCFVMYFLNYLFLQQQVFMARHQDSNWGGCKWGKFISYNKIPLFNHTIAPERLNTLDPLWHQTCFKGLVFLVKVLIWTFKKFDTADESFTKPQGVISSHFTASVTSQ